ncbi:hypothetical protein BJ138DRAFT_1153420 [Hygrophoropsis aurantiaca]|uniref:Uncharacterized protein n=1 Tax=Hygrophoropsis aurantiaca TaxID=72124 RepID=A0ACB8AAD2_9AGAM|nr:hypothetical protein BJ138DRAFT_1153420 [Hygrophoropsis aurantiaca]
MQGTFVGGSVSAGGITDYPSGPTESRNFDQDMALQYIAMIQQLIEPQFQQDGPTLTSPAATKVPCHIVSNGPACEGFIGVTKAEVSRHLRKRHGVNTASKGVTCPWNGCAARPMRGDSLARHVMSRHLGRGRVICGRCGKMFARSDAFKPHAVNGIQCDGTPLEMLTV